jgi:hypothetical protein
MTGQQEDIMDRFVAMKSFARVVEAGASFAC